MPVARFKMPDGRVARFEVPEGTSPEQAQAMMAQHFAQPKAAPKVQPSGFMDRLAHFSSPLDLVMSKGKQKLAATGFSIGLSDELAGVGRGLGSVMSGGGFVEAYRKGRDQERLAQRNARSSEGMGGTLAELGGGMLLPMGKIAQASSKGQLIRQGAKIGGLSGAVAGFGYGNGTKDSLAGSIEGGATGAALGAAVPVLAPYIASGGRKIGKAAVRGARAISGKPMPEADITGRARGFVSDLMSADNITPQMAGQAMDEAASRGVPLGLMDLGDNLRGGASALSRKPGDARTLVRNVLLNRQAQTGERIRGAVENNLGPIVNTFDEGDKLMNAAKRKAGPLFDQAFAQEPVYNSEIDRLLSTPAGKKALNRAATIAQNEGEDIAKLGFAVDDEGNAILRGPGLSLDEAIKANPDATQLVQPADERAALADAYRKTPRDIVSWIRSKGGLQDYRGELKSLGASNAARNIEFARDENFLGPLLSENGMTLDDAARAAWDAGYFPNAYDRPTVQEFLDALDGSINGNARVFHPNDAEALDKLRSARATNGAIENAPANAPLAEMRGELAGSLNDLNARAPIPDIGPEVERRYLPKALHYVKRGLDSVVEAQRDQFGRLNLSDDIIRSTNNVRGQFVGALKKQNPVYGQALNAYAGPAAANSALSKGKSAIRSSAEEIDRQIAKMGDFEKQQYAAGFRAAMADAISNSGDATDIVRKLLGTDKKRRALAKLFGGEKGLNDFIQTMNDEAMAFETYRRAMLGSPTAPNLADDAMVQDGAINALGPAALNMSRGRFGAAAGNLVGALGDVYLFGVGKSAQGIRNQAAALLTETNPKVLREVIAEAARQQALRQARATSARRAGVLLSRPVGQIAGASN